MSQTFWRNCSVSKHSLTLLGVTALVACSSPSTTRRTSFDDGIENASTADNQAAGANANRTGAPDDRVKWIKNQLLSQIRFVDASVFPDGVTVRYSLSFINPAAEDVRATGMPTPNGPKVRLYSDKTEILPNPQSSSGIEAYRAAPRDDEIKLYRYVVRAKAQSNSDVPHRYDISNDRLLNGTHVYEIVYWQTQLDWIDVREVLDRTDAQGKGRMRYPITDNAPSNRLYFKIYKPTDEEVAKGQKIEFLGEVDARTQRPAFPYARPGDFSPRSGYWQATGKSIEALGGYHEVFVAEGDSMPNLPGDVGVDPFSFQWKFVGEKSNAIGK